MPGRAVLDNAQAETRVLPTVSASTLVVAALAAAAAAQGAYHLTGKVLAAALLIGAVAVSIRDHALTARELMFRPVVTALALGSWAVISSVAAGAIASSAAPVLLVMALIAIVLVCRRESDPDVDVLILGVVMLGAVVAASGWVGVAWRLPPWALEDQGLWRAATTLTYANAAAGLLVPIALLAAGRLVRNRASSAMAAATCLLLIGIGATLSRGGIAALAIGAVILGRRVGFRPLVTCVARPLAGAGVGLIALSPSFTGDQPATLLAFGGLLAALIVASVPVPKAGRRTSAIVAGAALIVVVMGASGSAGDLFRGARGTRLTIASADRHQEAAAALRVASERPLTGVGPGQAVFSWREPDGSTLTARYAHNEYLQVLAELGVIGVALVAGLALSAGRAIRGGTVGAAAALVALALHSGLDFLWHIPVIPMVAAVVVGVASRPTPKESP